MDLIELCQQLATTLASNERIKNLLPNEVATNLQKTKQAMQDFAKESSRWKAPKDLDPLKKEFKKLVQDFDHAAFVAKDLLECGKEAKETDKLEASSAKKNWNNQRDKIATFSQTEGFGISDALARAFGDLLYALAVKPESVGLPPISPGDLELALTPLSDPSVFDSVKLLSPAPSGATQEVIDCKTYLHTALVAFRDLHKDAIKQKIKICEDDMKATKGPQSMCTMDVSTNPLKWNEDGGTQFFSQPGVVKHLVWRKLCMFFDGAITANAFRLHPQLITMYSGRAVVIVVSKEDAIANNADFAKWLSTLPVNGMQKYDMALLEEGCSVWVPLGFACVVIGVPTVVDWTAEIPVLAKRGKPKDKKDSKKRATCRTPRRPSPSEFTSTTRTCTPRRRRTCAWLSGRIG